MYIIQLEVRKFNGVTHLLSAVTRKIVFIGYYGHNTHLTFFRNKSYVTQI